MTVTFSENIYKTYFKTLISMLVLSIVLILINHYGFKLRRDKIDYIMITLIALIVAIFSIKTYKIEFNDITKTVNITESLFVGAKNEKKISYDEIKFTFSKNSFIKTQTVSSLKLDVYTNEKNEITIANLANFENLTSLIENSRQRFKTEVV